MFKILNFYFIVDFKNFLKIRRRFLRFKEADYWYSQSEASEILCAATKVRCKTIAMFPAESPKF